MNGQIDPGIKRFVAQKVAERSAWLASLKPGISKVSIIIHKTGARLNGTYKCHSMSTITVESTRHNLDKIHNRPTDDHVIDSRSEDVTFQFLDVGMGDV